MSRVLVIGGSDQGRQALDVLQCAGQHEVVGVLDRGLPIGSEVNGHPVVGRDDELAAAAGLMRADAYLVAIGDNFTRGRITGAARAACPDLALVSAVHPASVVSSSALVGAGAIVMASAVVSNGCVVGDGVLLGTKASLDHDCEVGAYASLAPNVTTGGKVRVGAYTALLLSASVIHGVAIGAHAVVGAGALVLDDLDDLVVAYGIPARVARTRDEGEAYLSRITR